MSLSSYNCSIFFSSKLNLFFNVAIWFCIIFFLYCCRFLIFSATLYKASSSRYCCNLAFTVSNTSFVSFSKLFECGVHSFCLVIDAYVLHLVYNTVFGSLRGLPLPCFFSIGKPLFFAFLASFVEGSTLSFFPHSAHSNKPFSKKSYLCFLVLWRLSIICCTISNISLSTSGSCCPAITICSSFGTCIIFLLL